MIGVLERDDDSDTERGDGRGMTQARIKVMYLHGKESRGSPVNATNSKR